jgi:hypothetical protein
VPTSKHSKEALEKEASVRDEINQNHQELIRLKTAAKE